MAEVHYLRSGVAETRIGPVLDSGGGNGNDGGMEERLKALETKVDRLGDEAASVKALLGQLAPKIDGLVKDVAEIKGRVSAMPSSWQLIGLIIAVFGLAFAVVKFAP